MKSCAVRLEEIADPENLREAFLRAARGHGASGDVLAMRANLDRELDCLRKDLLAESVEVGRFTAFTIFEPKQRRIHAPCLRERVLHHALIGACEPHLERRLIHDTYACRRGKGREAALRRAEGYAARHAWFLKLDIAKYFDSIPHANLLDGIDRGFRDVRVRRLWRRVVEAYEFSPGRGLPIGALTSQHLANGYLGPIDRLVKETLKIPGYVRYMDDMALWGDRDVLRKAFGAIRDTLRTGLGLELKASWHLQPTARGMDFLGYRVYSGGSRLNRASRRRFLRRWGGIERAQEAGAIDDRTAQRRVEALSAFVAVARRENVRQRLWAPAIGHEPRQPRRQLEQHGCELPLGQPQQEHAGQPQQQPRLPPRPELTPTGLERPTD